MTRQFLETKSNRWLGALMLACGVLMIVAMFHHPDAVNGTEATSGVMRWVHGVLIFLIIVNAYAVWRFVDQTQNKNNDLLLGATFYWISIAAFLGGTLVSGFVQSDVSDLYTEQVLNIDLFGAFNRFAAILNQTFIKFGLLSFGASGLIWAIPLISSGVNTKLIGVSGFIVGSCLVVSVLSGISPSVFSMTILTGLIVLWHGSIAIWFLRPNSSEGLPNG